MKKFPKIALVIVLTFLSLAAWAKEGGDQYPNGSENWFAGAAPPPGFYYLNYLGYYSGRLKDGSGRKAVLNGSTPQAEAIFDAFRFIEITKLKLFGASYGVHVIVPLVYQSVNMNGRNDKLSVGDIIIDPMILGWHRASWHFTAGFDVDLPTGHYNSADSRVSIGAHYYGFEPIIAFSYLPKSGWEGSAKIMYNIKTTNPDTHYHSGQDIHIDYAAGKHVGQWTFGTTGYFLEQTTDDSIHDQIVPESPDLWSTGRRGQVLGIGPSIGYTNKRHMVFLAQWQRETLVRNRFGGDKVWFKMIIPTSSIFSKH